MRQMLRLFRVSTSTILTTRVSGHSHYLETQALIEIVFNSPLPNAQLWNGPTIGALQNEHTFKGGGWWHDPDVLSSTGEGLDKEEPRAWEGWWNETIVNTFVAFFEIY